MHSKTILQAKEDLRQKKYSAVELTEAVYQRIDSVEPKVQAFVHLTRDIALKQAQTADQKLATGEDAPLLGIPIALKDLICTQGTQGIGRLKFSINSLPLTMLLWRVN